MQLGSRRQRRRVVWGFGRECPHSQWEESAIGRTPPQIIDFYFRAQNGERLCILGGIFTVRLHVMQRTVLLSEFCLSVRPSDACIVTKLNNALRIF